MSTQQRKEVEAKFYLGPTLDALDDSRMLLEKLGFKLTSSHLETDFLPDTAQGLLKKHAMLLRVRQKQDSQHTSLIITLKKRKKNSRVIEFEEVETKLHPINQSRARYISQELLSITGHKLEWTQMKGKSFDELIQFMKATGLPKVRILLDKYRESYIKGEAVVTLDYFPDGMGSFLEVETYSEKNTIKISKKLGFSDKEFITLDYGDLLKVHKSGESRQLRRQALFSPEERISLLRGAS